MRIRRAIGFSGLLLAFSLFIPACGSSGGTADTTASGLDGSKKLITLTDAEKGMLCDWMVGRAGSYGNPGSCDRTQTGLMSTFLTYDDQAACIADARGPTYTACQATVAQMEACIETLPACATLGDASNSSACAVLSNC
jgi:hypothetical protein